MVALATGMEFSNYCPQLDCGERLDAGEGAQFCGACGRAFNACRACGATNRLLAQYCRGCGRGLDSVVWPLQAGLQSRTPQHGTISSIGAVKKPFPIRLGSDVLAPPVAADGLIVVATRDGRVVLLGETDGGRLGEINLEDTVAVAPALCGSVLFVAARRTLRAFDLAELLGQPRQLDPLLWKADCGGDAISQPLLADDKAVYVVTQAGQKAMLEAFAQSDGRRLWPSPLHLDSSFITSPVLAGGELLFSTPTGQLILASPETGEVRASLALGRNIDLLAGSYVAGDRVVMADVDGRVFEIVVSGGGPKVNELYGHGARITALAANERLIALGHTAGLTLLDSRGQVKWSYDNLDAISVTPIVAGESIFAVDDAGNGLLFSERRSNPTARVKLFGGEINTPPLMTRKKLAACSAGGLVAVIDWR